MVTIIDYKVGNIGSIKNMIQKIGFKCQIESDYKKILASEKVILPGVGAFDNGMKNLKDSALVEVLNEFALVQKKPILGICLGMQLMAQSSSEGNEPGLGWMPLKVASFQNAQNFKAPIPVMGWNYVKPSRSNPLLSEENNRFYFVHSFYFERNENEIITTQIEDFSYCAAFQKDNIFGVQFHPEKSHKFGMGLLRNFCQM
jgi:imidazole glycerol-phosphate synthase subunit HisH